VALDSSYGPESVPVTFNAHDIKTVIKHNTLKLDELFAVSSEEELENLDPNTSAVFSNSLMVILPPMITAAWTNVGTKDMKLIFLETLQSF